MRRALSIVLLVICAVLARDAGADVPSVVADNARDLIIGLDLDAARALLAKADANDPHIALERARLALYDGDCDAADAILSNPQMMKIDEDEYLGRYEAGLSPIARGCARATAATIIEEDKAANVWVRFQDDADRVLMPLLVDTIVDTGTTMDCLFKKFGARHPATLKAVVLLDKKSHRTADITMSYIGFEIPDKFVVGYGMDHGGKYRNLPYITTLKPAAH